MTIERPQSASAECAAAEQPQKDSRRSIFDLAVRMARDDFGTGALASLRRHNPSDVMNEPSFHRLIANLPDEMVSPGNAPLRWATVIQAVAIGTKPGELLPKERAGAALAAAGYSESRFARLLASHGGVFRDQIVLLARYMNSKMARFSWTDLGELVLVEGLNEVRAERLRFNIARDYYRQLDAQQKQAAA